VSKIKGMNINKEFGMRVRELRKAKGLSQEKLASQARVHPNYIGMVERAERNITLENIKKIADGLGVDIPTLFYFSESSEKKERLIAEILQEVSLRKPRQLATIIRLIKSL
jgi:XRE family transcriptional regulator, regulator of sulfur utilization